VLETQVITKAGDMKEVAIKANIFELNSRNVLQGLFRDITEAKRAEEERSRLVTAVEQAGEMIIVTDTDGIVQYVNPAFETVTGYSWEEAIGRHIEALVKGGEHDEMLHQHLSETLGRGETWRERFTSRRKDGSLYQADSTISPVRDAAGNIISFVRVERDLTDQLALEAKIQQAQKQESLGVLAGGIAHDFNNLMMGIIGNADLALMDLPPKTPGRLHVKRIETAAGQVAELTNQMLAYSGKGRYVVEPIDLNRLVEEMMHLLQTVISKKTTLQFYLAQDLPALEADAGQVRQVVMNLITNASEAIGDSNGAISVTTGVVEADRASISGSYLNEDVPEGRYVYLEVLDTGSGMDAKTQEKIFDPFFTTKFIGRGLGLAAVLGIVRGHRGVIQVSSDPGRGTTFKVLFPCVGDLAAVRAEQPIMVESAGPGATILVVDDDEAVRDVLKPMLEAAGYRVLTAADGREGVGVFRQHCDEISLVLLDMTMPHMDGKAAFREMRSIRSDVWVILSSGYNEPDATRQFADNGLTGFIQKPYRSATLLTKIQEGLGQA
jgi:PAS domain S-box-containing protein